MPPRSPSPSSARLAQDRRVERRAAEHLAQLWLERLERLPRVVRAEVTWILEMHGLFQLHYYGHHIGVDPDGRDAYRDHPWFDSCVEFCERWDQASFDPDHPWEPLESFEPLLREVFSRPSFDPAILREPR